MGIWVSGDLGSGGGTLGLDDLRELSQAVSEHLWKAFEELAGAIQVQPGVAEGVQCRG